MLKYNSTLKNSVNNKTSRYVMGGKTEITPGFLGWWDKDFLQYHSSDLIYVLEKKFEQRPDLLSFSLYDDPSLWWVICQYNAILDFNTEFLEGVVLRIPTKNRVNSLINQNKTGGTSVKTNK